MTRIGGVVTHVTPAYVQVSGLSRHLKLGDCISFASGSTPQLGEVVRIDKGDATIKPFDANLKIGPGEIGWLHGNQSLRPHASWKGRVLNALGAPIDGLGPLQEGEKPYAFDAEPPSAMSRQRVRKPLKSGVRVMDLFTPLCAGQRIGIFAGSGVGKSTLLSMLARSQGFDTVVLALVGERGREVREFLEDALAQNRSRAVTVVSTGDESPMMRRLAPKTALAIAEFYRDAGDSVLLIVDSVTRFAHATREVALAAGEAPVARGYTPSVFSELPKLLERAGPGEEGAGSITGVFSVLVDGDDHNDPDCRQHPRHARRPYRARAQDRGPGPLSGRQRADLRLAPREFRLVSRGTQAGHDAARDDRSLRGHARPSPHGRLSARRRR